MSVRDLKKKAEAQGVNIECCIEKSELVDMISPQAKRQKGSPEGESTPATRPNASSSPPTFTGVALKARSEEVAAAIRASYLARVPGNKPAAYLNAVDAIVAALKAHGEEHLTESRLRAGIRCVPIKGFVFNLFLQALGSATGTAIYTDGNNRAEFRLV